MGNCIGSLSAGGSGGGGVPSSKINRIQGVNGTSFTTYSEISGKSPNTIWAEDTSRPHAVFSNEQGSVRVSGEKTDRFALVNSVNTAVVHIKHIDPDNYNKRDVTRLNKTIELIKSMGYDTPLAYTDKTETLIYVKRNRFTKNF